MSVLADCCQKRSFLVQELYEHWEAEHREAMQACDAEDLCGEYLDVARLMNRWWARLSDDFFRTGLSDLSGPGRLFLSASRRMARLGGLIHELAVSFRARNYTVEGSDDVKLAAVELDKLAAQAAEYWKPWDPKDSDAAHAAYLRGEYDDVEDLLRERTS